MAESILQSRRFRVWAALLVLFAAAVVVLVLAMRSGDPTGLPTPAAARLLVVDEAGVPIKSAVTFVRREAGTAPDEGTAWDPEAATLSLAATDVRATVLIGAPGHRVTRLVGVRGDQTVILERGYIVRLTMGEDAPPLEPPLVGLFRVRPSATTSSLGEGEGTRPLDLEAMMAAVHKSRPDAPELPTDKFGFSVSETDGAAGFRVPAPGTYEVVWGMLHEKPVTWYTIAPTLTIDVIDTNEPQVFEFEIDRPLWNRTREGLQEQYEKLHGSGG